MSEDLTINGEITTFDSAERMVYGWAWVSAKNGEPFTDLHGDRIGASLMEKAATDFMLEFRRALTMHRGTEIGTIVHSLPITKQIAEALDIQSHREGWVIGMKVFDDQVWAKVESGELRGFSIGGYIKRRVTNAAP